MAIVVHWYIYEHLSRCSRRLSWTTSMNVTIGPPMVQASASTRILSVDDMSMNLGSILSIKGWSARGARCLRYPA